MDLRTTAASTPDMPRAAVEEAVQDMNGLLAEHLATVRMDIWSSFEQMMMLIKQRAEALQKESSRQLESDISELRMENRALREQLKVQVDAAEVRRLGTRDDAAEAFRAGSRDSLSRDSSAGGETRPPNSVCWVEEISDRVGTECDVPLKTSTKPYHLSPLKRPDDGALTEVDEHTSPPAHALECESSSNEPEDLPKVKSKSVVHFGGGTRTDVDPRASIQSDASTISFPTVSPSKATAFSKATNHRATKNLGAKSVTKFFGVAYEDTAVKDTKAGKARVSHAQQKVFADAAAMKERVRAAVTKPEYNVADYYWDSGWCQYLARHPVFEYATLGVIAFNAVWIWIDVDNNDKELLMDAHPVFQIAENFFCIFFTVEWAIRWGAFREKRFALKDAWFCFDTVLVVIMILETWVMTLMFLIIGNGQSGNLGNTSVLKLIRLIRLTRMARMAKLLRAVPELIILIKGIWVAARSVLFTLLLLFIIIYFFAIVLRQITSETEIGDKYYKSVPAAMSSLLLDAVLPDQAYVVRDNGDANIALGCLMLVFILLSSLTVMNMLVGILCEVVSVVSAVEKEQLTVNYVKQKLENMFVNTMVDADGSKTISKIEFENMLTNEETAKIIQDIGVDVIGLVDFTDIIFEDDDIELSFGDFMELVMQLRGTNNCTVKDMVDLRKFVVTELNAVTERTIQAMYDLMGSEPDDHFANGKLVADVRRPPGPLSTQRLTRANSRPFTSDYGHRKASLRHSRHLNRPLPLGQPTDLPGSTIT